MIEKAAHPVRWPHETSPSDGWLRIVVELGLRETRCGKLNEVHVPARNCGNDQFGVLLSKGGDDLHIGVEAFAVDQFLEVRKQLWRAAVRAIIMDESEIVP